MVLPVGLFVGFSGPLELRKKCRAPKGKSFVDTTVLVDSGAYAIVRHPQYLGAILLMSPLSNVPTLVSLILGVILSVLFYVETPSEEHYLIEQFGDDYKRSMQRYQE